MREHRAKIGTLFLIVFIDLIGFGIIIPILPLYAEQFGPSPLAFGLLMASFSLMQFVFAPVLGRLSDRFGRRPILLISLIGSAVGYVLFGFAGSMGMLFASRIVDGISGANISTAQAVIADITTPEDRAKGMGAIGAAFGLGFILGPAIGGLLVSIAHWLPGVAAAVTSLIAAGLVLAVLPETLDPEAGVKAARRRLDLRSLARAMAHPFLGLCLIMVLFIIFAFSNFETTFAQFVQFKFALTKSQISFLFVYAGVLAALVQGGLAGRLTKRFGEAKLVTAGTFLGFLGLGFLPYLGSLGLVMVSLAVLAMGQGIASPALSSLTSKLVAADEVGGVMGVYQSMSSLGRIGGPFWAEMVYGMIGVAWPYRTGSLFMLLACGISLIVLARLKGIDPTSHPATE
ncbi:MAG: MFS transporter [Acidobacteria bacterium]|nr:MFS transporter [Acidobacteriota bacterium]